MATIVNNTVMHIESCQENKLNPDPYTQEIVIMWGDGCVNYLLW